MAQATVFVELLTGRRFLALGMAAIGVPAFLVALAVFRALVVPGDVFEDYPLEPSATVVDGPFAQLLTPYSVVAGLKGKDPRWAKYPVANIRFSEHTGKWIVLAFVQVELDSQRLNDNARIGYERRPAAYDTSRYYADLKRRLDEFHPDAELWLIRTSINATGENPVGRTFGPGCIKYYSAGCADRFLTGVMDRSEDRTGFRPLARWLMAMHGVDASTPVPEPYAVLTPLFAVVSPDGKFFPVTGRAGTLTAQHPPPQPMVMARHLARLRIAVGEEREVPAFIAPDFKGARYGYQTVDFEVQK